MVTERNEEVQEKNSLKCSLKECRELTLQLIQCVEKEEYDSLEALLKDRQNLLDKMNLMQYSQEEFRSNCEEFQIVQLQNELAALMNEKKNRIRLEMDKLAANRIASKNYRKGFAVDSIFLNKRT